MKNKNYKTDIGKIYENFILNESDDIDENDDAAENADFEVGETNYPHGDGYPNKFLYDNYDDRMYIDFIADVPPNENEEYYIKVNNWFMDYIKNKFKHNIEFVNKMSKLLKRNDYRSSIYEIGNWWYDTLDADDRNHVDEIYEKLSNLTNNPSSTQESENYPLYVSLYDVTKVYMGGEEGGYWPKSYDLIKSVKVQNPKQMENTAKQLLNLINSYDIDGKAEIYVERRKGSQIQVPKSWLENELSD